MIGYASTVLTSCQPFLPLPVSRAFLAMLCYIAMLATFRSYVIQMFAHLDEPRLEGSSQGYLAGRASNLDSFATVRGHMRPSHLYVGQLMVSLSYTGTNAARSGTVISMISGLVGPGLRPLPDGRLCRPRLLNRQLLMSLAGEASISLLLVYPADHYLSSCS